MAIKLALKYGGGEVDFVELLEFFRENDYVVIIGAQKYKLEEHTKPYSLDYWLRTHGAKRKDTMQATKDWINENLFSTGKFVPERIKDPRTGSYVKAVRLLNKD